MATAAAELTTRSQSNAVFGWALSGLSNGGSIYGRNFEDPDGHQSAPMWMNLQMAEHGAHPVESATADNN
jgi:predicted lactoylglutathione lyase